LLAGDEVALTLFLQSTTPQPPARDLYISLIDRDGTGVAGWQGWPLPGYQTQTWAEGALVQVPIHFFLAPDLVAESYTLIAGFVDSSTGNKGTPVTLNRVQLRRRPASFTAPAIKFQVTPPATLGTHADLMGYDIFQQEGAIQLDLLWHVRQPLLPPHHIFVHLEDAAGDGIAQSDGEPVTASGRAPTGSWLPGEYLITHHTLTVPPNSRPPFTLHTGLYLPSTGARLPVTVEDTVTGDSVTISLPSAP
jgi:hypothetical protein